MLDGYYRQFIEEQATCYLGHQKKKKKLEDIRNQLEEFLLHEKISERRDRWNSQVLRMVGLISFIPQAYECKRPWRKQWKESIPAMYLLATG